MRPARRRAGAPSRRAAAGIPTAGQALPHLLARAAACCVAVLGPLRGERRAFVAARDWLGEDRSPALDGAARERALAELARRYLDGHGPATVADLAAWSGLSQRDAAAGVGALGGQVVVDGELLALEQAPARAALPPRLLPSFDPYLLGWKDRGFAVAEQHRRAVHPGGGIVRAAAVVDDRVVATWRRDRRGGVELDELEPLAAADRAALRQEADDVRRFEGAGA